MEALVKKHVKVWKPNVTKSNVASIAKSAYKNSSPYLTESRVCSICGTSSDVISM